MSTKRESVTHYRVTAHVVTPIAEQTFTEKNWWEERRHARQGGVLEEVGKWIQRLESMTDQELQADSVVTVSIETRTVRTITLTDVLSRVTSVLKPRSDQYGNQFWKGMSDAE